MGLFFTVFKFLHKNKDNFTVTAFLQWSMDMYSMLPLQKSKTTFRERTAFKFANIFFPSPYLQSIKLFKQFAVK